MIELAAVEAAPTVQGEAVSIGPAVEAGFGDLDREAQNRSRGDFSSQRFQGFQGGGFDRFGGGGGFGGDRFGGGGVDSVVIASVAVVDLEAVALAVWWRRIRWGFAVAGDDEN